MIYHYCDSDTFLKILESQSLWLSDILKMNDPLEYQGGYEIIIGVFGEKYPEMLEWVKNNHFHSSPKGILILGCSFTDKDKGDNLSQWRAYGEDGKGVSIGVSKEDVGLIVSCSMVEKYAFLPS